MATGAEAGQNRKAMGETVLIVDDHAGFRSRGRGSVAERGLGAAAQDGSEPAAMRRQPRPPDCIDAAPHAVKAPASKAGLDGVAVKAEREQLTAGNNAMLALHQLPHRRRSNDWASMNP